MWHASFFIILYNTPPRTLVEYLSCKNVPISLFACSCLCCRVLIPDMNLSVPIRTHQDPSGPTRTHQDPPGPTRTHQDPSGPTRTHQDPPGPIRTHQDPPGPTRSHQDPSGPTRTHQDPSGPIKTHQDPPGPIRTHQDPPGPTRTHQVPSGPIRTPWFVHDIGWAIYVIVYGEAGKTLGWAWTQKTQWDYTVSLLLLVDSVPPPSQHANPYYIYIIISGQTFQTWVVWLKCMKCDSESDFDVLWFAADQQSALLSAETVLMLKWSRGPVCVGQTKHPLTSHTI